LGNDSRPALLIKEIVCMNRTRYDRVVIDESDVFCICEVVRPQHDELLDVPSGPKQLPIRTVVKLHPYRTYNVIREQRFEP
jgi:hypothetical protein